MEFVLKGFNTTESIRRFVFETIGADRTRGTVAVTADLTLVRRHAIQVQNLPLLCRQLLESLDPATIAGSTVSLTEASLAEVNRIAKAAVEEKKPRKARPPVSSNVGKAWRGPANAMLMPKMH